MQIVVEDVLYVIFSFFEPKSVKFVLNCRLVCKDWNHIITHSPAIWSFFKVCITNVKAVPKYFFPLFSNIKWKNISDDDLEFAKLQKWTSLKKLKPFESDKLTDEGMKTLSIFSSLQTLKLFDCNEITASGFQSLSQLTSISALSIYQCNLTNDGLRGVSNLTALRVLDLFRESFETTNITDDGLKLLTKLVLLQKLDLSNCSEITDRGLEYISKLTELRELYLDGTDITDNGLKTISQSFTSLQILSLAGCGFFVTDIGLKSLANLTSIHTLYLPCFHEITDNGLKSLSTLTSLRKLDVFCCKQITENGLKSLSSLIALKRPTVKMRCENGMWIFD